MQLISLVGLILTFYLINEIIMRIKNKEKQEKPADKYTM
jgi:hypothetical protein